VGGTNTRATVLHRLVCDRELSQVVSNHLSLDFHSVEDLSVVDTDHASNHLGNDNHVTKVSLHSSGPLSSSLAFNSPQLLEQVGVLLLESTLEEPAALTSTDELGELLSVHVEEVVQIHSTVGELLEGPLLSSRYFSLDLDKAGCKVLKVDGTKTGKGVPSNCGSESVWAAYRAALCGTAVVLSDGDIVKDTLD